MSDKEMPYTLTVKTGRGAMHQIANPLADPHLEWMLRYAPDGLNDPKNCARLAAASVISGFDYLLSADISMKEATERLRMMRAARKEAIKNTRWNPSHDRP